MVSRVVLIISFICLLSGMMWGASDSIDRVYNYPNPYIVDGSNSVTIAFVYTNNSGSAINLSFYIYIYDLIGYKVMVKKPSATATYTANTGVNTFTFSWNGKNDKGRSVAPGIYFTRIVVEGGDGSVQTLSGYGKMLVK